MVRFANISGKKAVKAFVRSGYIHIHTSGDNAIMQKPGYPSLSIPLHKEVAPFLLKSQIKRAKLTEKDFLRLLKRKKL